MNWPILKKKYLIVGGVFFLLTAFWLVFAAPRLLGLPRDFSFTADVLSIDDFYDEERGVYSGGVYSKTEYRYETVTSENGVSLIANSFNVRSPGDEPIFMVERLYGIDQKTGRHVAGFGDKDREGYLFAPRHLEEDDTFTYWHVNYDGPAHMTFAGTEELYGLKTFRFETSFEDVKIDQTENLDFLPEVGETRGIELEPYLQIWVEPLTGRLIKYEDDTVAYYYDLETGERQNPWNYFSNRFHERSVEVNVRQAQWARTLAQVVEIYIPILLVLAGLIFCIKGLRLIKPTINYFNFERLRFIVGGFVTGVGAMSFWGWIESLEIFIRVLPNSNAMNPLTALCFVLLGLSLLFLKTFDGRVSLFLGAIIVLISGVRIIESVELIGTSIDLMLFQEAVLSYEIPARMAQYTAFSFLLLGAVQISFHSAVLKRLYFSKILTSLVFLFSLIVIVGYLFQSFEILSIPEFFFAAIHTALLFLISSAFIYSYCSRQDEYSLSMRSWVSLSTVLLGAVLITTIVASALNIFLTSEAQTSFNVEIDRITRAIEERTNIYIAALDGARGFHSASEEVNRDEWKSYVDSLKIQENYPGVQGFGYAVFVPPEEKQAHIESVRAEGFSDYTIRPEGERDLYSAIIYLEPFDKRNEQAFGYDMYSNAVRRSAMEQARDSGEATMSGRITLVQEIDDDVQPGFLIYVPYYGNNASFDTIEERRENIVGYVYSPFRARNFVEGIFHEEDISNVGIRIQDGTRDHTESLLYDDTQKLRDGARPRFEDTRVLYVAGRPWLLSFVSSSDYGVTTFSRIIVPLIVLIGIAVGALISLMFYTLVSARQKALAYADKMTKGLRKAKAKDEAMLASIGDGFIATDQKGTILLVNKTFEKLLGWEASEVEGKHISEVVEIFDEAGKKLLAKNQPIVKMLSRQSGAVTSAILQYKRKDGSIFPVAVTASLILVDGVVVGAVEVFRDITFEKQVDKAKTEFVSLASHQLRTPLTAVNWYAEMLLEGDIKIGDEEREYIELIYTSNQRMVELVNALLDVSRIELGTFGKEEIEEVDLPELVDSVIQEQKNSLQSRKQKLKVDFEKEIPLLKGNRKQLRMVFQNLISNAIKYTGEGGNIGVSLSVDRNMVIVTVSDTGMGIPKAQQSKIFTKLFRANNVKATDTEGTGLGLYIVKSIVENNGGTITFESEENKGSTFRVSLPLHRRRKSSNKG